jgi:hypothetical protein
MSPFWSVFFLIFMIASRSNTQRDCHEIFRPVFWPVMNFDASRPECEPLLFLKFLWCSFDSSFGAFHTKPSRRFIQSPRRIDNWICGYPINRDTLLFVEEHSRRTEELVVNYSRRFSESRRSIDTLCSISLGTTNPEKRKIGEPWIQLVWNSSVLKLAV